MNFPNRVPVLANPQEGSSMANPSRALKAKSCWREVSGMERLRGQMYPPVGLLNIILLALLACLPAAPAGAALGRLGRDRATARFRARPAIARRPARG